MFPSVPRSPSRSLARSTGVGARSASVAIALGALLATSAFTVPAAPTGVLAATDAAAEDVPVSGEACPDDQGVTVVVDFPGEQDDEPGEIVVGCADGADDGAMTGTEALQAAGFTDTRDGAAMVCAIDSFPDPCPTGFEGVWWSYWYADADTGADAAGEWQQYMEGPDTVATQSGRVEGWRYFDGSEGPRVEPTALADVLASAPDEGPTDGAATPSEDETTVEPGPEETADPDGTDTTDETADPDADAAVADDGGVPAWVWFAGVLVLLALIVLAVNAMRRPADGPRGQD